MVVGKERLSNHMSKMETWELFPFSPSASTGSTVVCVLFFLLCPMNLFPNSCGWKMGEVSFLKRTNRSAHGHTTCWVTSSTQIVCEPSLLVVWSLHSYVLCIIKETFSCLKAALVTQAKVWFNLPKLKKLWIWETCPPEKIQRLFAHFLLAIIRRLVMMWKHFGVEQNIMELNHEVMETRLVVVFHALWLDMSQL